MAFRIEPAVRVTNGDGASVYLSVHEVDGERFFNLSKGRLADQLFLHGLRTKECDRPVSRTTIVQDIRQLKDHLVYKECKVKNKQWNRQSNVLLITLEDTFKEITLPAIGEEPSRNMKVVLNKPGASDLLVELNSDTLEYIGRVMVAQFNAHDGVAPKKERDPLFDDMGLAHMGVTTKNGRECIRAFRKLGENGKVAKYIRLDDHENSLEKAAQRAQSWQIGEVAHEPQAQADQPEQGVGQEGESDADQPPEPDQDADQPPEPVETPVKVERGIKRYFAARAPSLVA